MITCVYRKEIKTVCAHGSTWELCDEYDHLNHKYTLTKPILNSIFCLYYMQHIYSVCNTKIETTATAKATAKAAAAAASSNSETQIPKGINI